MPCGRLRLCYFNRKKVVTRKRARSRILSLSLRLHKRVTERFRTYPVEVTIMHISHVPC